MQNYILRLSNGSIIYTTVTDPSDSIEAQISDLNNTFERMNPDGSNVVGTPITILYYSLES